MQEIKLEDLIENSPIPVSIEGTEKILSQMKNSICKIYSKDGKKGTGFFLKTSFNNKILYFLVTNYHVLEALENRIEITRNDDNISNDINLNNKRKIFKYPEMDVILIEINPKDDKINKNVFLEIDENINKDITLIEKEYRKKSVYILHYPGGDIIKVSYGLLKGINNMDLNHYCNTLGGSSGSPIISLKNFKVIGIHKGSPKNNNFKFNKGIFIKEVLNILYKDLQNKINRSIEANKEINIINNLNSINLNNQGNYTNKKNEYSKNNLMKVKNKNNLNIPLNQQQNSKYYYFLGKGLSNIGSTYYMNAILQCFLHISELIDYFLNYYPKESLNLGKINNKIKSQGILSKAFYELVIGVSFHNSTEFSPMNFKLILDRLKSVFINYESNEPKDLIINLLQTMHDELNYNDNNTLPSNNNFPDKFNREEMLLYFNHYKKISIISTLFHGTYENVLKCLECKKKTYNFQYFEFINFGMHVYHKKTFNIYDGFTDNEKEKLFTGGNQFYCTFCKKLCDAKYCSKIFQIPNKLLIYIDYGKNKIFQPSKIEFEDIINITKYVNSDFGYELKYRIIGVCTYFGQSGNYGHYIAFCKNRLTNQWYKFNDSSCNKCIGNEIYGGLPHLLLYEKID